MSTIHIPASLLNPNFMFHREIYVGPEGKGLIWAPTTYRTHPGRFVYIAFNEIENSLYIDLLKRACDNLCGCSVLYTDIFRYLTNYQIYSNVWHPPENYCKLHLPDVII